MPWCRRDLCQGFLNTWNQVLGWVWHDSISYLFHQEHPNEIKQEAKEKTGNLRDIFGLSPDTLFRMESFSLWLEHGKKPNGGKYAYTVLPGKSPTETKTYEEKQPIAILANNSEVQAVLHKQLQFGGLVFYQAGEVLLNEEQRISVDHPCLVLIHLQTGELWLSDPSTKSKSLSITLINNRESETIAVQLPQGSEAGKSVKVK